MFTRYGLSPDDNDAFVRVSKPEYEFKIGAQALQQARLFRPITGLGIMCWNMESKKYLLDITRHSALVKESMDFSMFGRQHTALHLLARAMKREIVPSDRRTISE